MGAIFLCDNVASYAMMCALVVVLTVISGIPPMTVFRSVKPLWWIMLLTFCIHLVSHEGEEIFRVAMFVATWDGFWQGIFISLRLALLIIFSSLLTFTTRPLQLTDAMEYLLSPLKSLGVPAHELAMMMTIALRFVPTLIEETDKIMKAQQSRGVDFNEGSLKERVKNVIPILVPLFIASFRRAEELALAMEARCYYGSEGRTRMKVMRMTKLDALAVGVLVVFGVVLYMVSYET